MRSKIGRIGLVLALASTYLLQISAPLAQAATSYTFTPAGATGVNGPLQSEVTTAYAATTLAGAVTINTRGIQEWTVPASGQYRITAKGASGGKGKAGGVLANIPGFGAQLVGTFSLTSGTVLKIAVGQEGQVQQSNDGGGGGGGGSFVVTSTGTILIIAGGGGGGGGRALTTANGVSASLTTSGTLDNQSKGTAGTSGGGGSSTNATWGGGGGGGYSGNGVGYVNSAGSQGYSFTNGATGGAAYASYPAVGGFGGGGGVAFAGGGGGGYSGGAGGDGSGEPYTGGGGGGSINNGTSTSASLLSTYGSGSVLIESLGPSLTNFAPRTTITNSSTIIYDIGISESVTGLAANDFSLSGTGSSTCSIGTPSGSGTTYTVTLTSCSAGTVILTMASGAATNGSAQTVPSTNTAASTVTIDQTSPAISSISKPTDGTFLPGQSLSFTAAFSETVTVSGTPRLSITIGSTTRYATYTSGSNSSSLNFSYTVQTSLSDIDLDGIALVSPLDLNSGSISDLATNTLSTLSFSPPSMNNVLVAQKPGAPTIDSISATSGQLAVYFTPGNSNGSAITNYEYSTNNGTNWTTRSAAATTSPITITGLSNGTSYPVRIRAINAAGSGDSSTAVSATPSAVVVNGGSNISITYGQSGTSSQYTATGGTGVYTFTLSSTPSGISISNAIVSVDSTTAAGTYTLNVIATDNAGSPQSGLKQIVITIAKASTSITIALPGSASTAALNGAVTITATVSKPGTVNFKLGGTTISGCGSASALSTTASCSWTPNALGSVSITAIFTPTDLTNYETSTTTTLTITVVNGVSTITLTLTGGTTTPPKGQTINIIATIDQAGKVTFFADGKRIPGCYNVSASSGNKNCAWKPAVQKQVNLTATLTPTNSVYNPSSARLVVIVVRRSGTR